MTNSMRHRWFTLVILTIGFLLAALFPQFLLAQANQGSIIGTVTDHLGSLVPGAVISVTNLGTAEKRTDTADKNGSYRIPNLLPGSYREEVEVGGFKHFTREPVEVEVDSTVRIDVSMEVGATNETITVSSETPLLQTEGAALSQVVGRETVQEMPLNGRNVTNLVALIAGVVPQASTAGAASGNSGAGRTSANGFNNYQIGGGAAGSSTSFLDGAPLNGLGDNTVVLVPVQDAVGEFRVATNSVSAEFGRFGGGVINFATKSGANELHGSAYEYFRNKVLNASAFFTKSSGLPKGAYNQNQYGGTLGGAIRKDKTFFFVSYEGYKAIVGTTVITSVPTAAERAGNFSADATIYDPFTTQVNNGIVTRQPFLNNQIPMNRFDFAANTFTNVLNYFPLPNTVQSGGDYARTPVAGGTTKQGNGRIDENLSQKQHLFARFTYWQINDIPVNTFGNLTAGAGSTDFIRQAVAGDSYALNANTTFDLRVSYTRSNIMDRSPSFGRDLSVFGPAFASLASQVTFSTNFTPQITNLYQFNGQQQVGNQIRDTSAIVPNVDLIRGRHDVKVGADLRYLDFNYVSDSSPSGTFAFNNGFTSADGTTSSKTGNAIASFLLGTPASGSITTTRALGQYSKYQGYYVTDTWQTRQNLTLSLGIRWELPGAWLEKHDLATVLLPNGVNSLGTINGLSTQGGLAFVNSSAWAPRGTEDSKHDLFAPRLGVSYSPTALTALRAGYAITYPAMDLFNGAEPANSPINSATTATVTSVNGGNLIPLNTLSDPFPANGVAGTVQQSILQPSGRSTTYLNSLNGLSISGPVPHIRFPYTQQWNANVQQQFPEGSLLQIAYAGSRGTFLPQGLNGGSGSTNNLNQLPDQYDAMGSALLTSVANPLAGKVNSSGSLNGSTVLAGQLLRPFPQYSNVIQTNAKGDNIYHSLQVSLQKRFIGGGVLLSNYTWAKNIGNISGTTLGEGLTVGSIQDFTNIKAERSVLNFDVRHRFVTSAVLPLPFGKGKKFLSNASGFTGGLVSGWETNGIVTFQTGFALSLVAQNNALASSFGAGVIRPNVVAGCSTVLSGSAQSRLAKWFNTACFTAPANFAFGNESRVDNALRAAGIANYDVALSKNTGITERLKLQLRGEVFNLFNRVQFAAPNTTVGNGAFGTVASTINQPRLIQVSARLLF